MITQTYSTRNLHTPCNHSAPPQLKNNKTRPDPILGTPYSEPPAAPTDGSYQVVWEKWSPAAIAAAQAAGKYVYVDFTARWCATCQTNKAAVFHDREILAELAKKKVVLLRADWTNRDPLITAELARWNRSAVPFNLIYAPGKPDPVVLPELLTPGKVLTAFAEISP